MENDTNLRHGTKRQDVSIVQDLADLRALVRRRGKHDRRHRTMYQDFESVTRVRR
jgi:hypothetical protein